MKPTLSKREQLLILVAAYIAIGFVLVQFAILPAYRAYQAKQERQQVLTAEKTVIDMRIAGEASYISQNEAHHARLDEIKAVYPPVMRNERIDDVLTGLCVSSGLDPISLTLSAVQSDGGTETQSAEDAPKPPDAFFVVAAKMTASGSIDHLLQLLGRVETMEHIRISRLSFQDYVYTGTWDYAERSITLYFEVTMLQEGQ